MLFKFAYVVVIIGLVRGISQFVIQSCVRTITFFTGVFVDRRKSDSQSRGLLCDLFKKRDHIGRSVVPRFKVSADLQ